MSLDVYLMQTQPAEVYSANITHNLNKMAKEAGIYHHLWRPDDIGLFKASELIDPLTKALSLMRSNPEKFKKFDAENKWGVYEDFIRFVREYLKACIKFPDADIEISR